MKRFIRDLISSFNPDVPLPLYMHRSPQVQVIQGADVIRLMKAIGYKAKKRVRVRVQRAGEV